MQTPSILHKMEEYGQFRCTGVCSPLLSVLCFSDLSSFQGHAPHEHSVHMRKTDRPRRNSIPLRQLNK